MSIQFKLNGKAVTLADDRSDMPLLWYLREVAGLKGTKVGCGIGQCGACTVHSNGKAMRSCLMPVSSIAGSEITTIEGLAKSGNEPHPVQQAWLELDVAQCGYCQAGQIMSAAALLKSTAQPTDDEIDAQMTNLCRCGTYVRIRQGIKRAAELRASRLKSASSGGPGR